MLARNVIWNVVGICSPILVAIICLPILKRALGTERLGIISLAWVVVGYFGMFDLGLSRALTKLVAEKLGQKRTTEIVSLVWTSLFLLAGIGLIGTLIAVWLTPWIVERALKVPLDLQQETMGAFYWICTSIPFIVITAGLRGVLEALQQFRLATWIRVPMGIFSYLGPVAILPFTHNLETILAVLVFGRVMACIAHLLASFYALPELKHRLLFQRSMLGPLLSFGSWMTVSNIVGPLMVTFDRFVIGAMISISAVAYYAVPSEAVMKVTLIPLALMGVLFPAFSTAGAVDRSRLVLLCDAASRYLFIILLPAIIVLVAFAPDGLRLWLGQDFASKSTTVVRLLAVAVFINAQAQIPYAHLQSAGRPDITAKVHLSEVPIYAVLLFTLVRTMGISGAALAWALRVTLDAVLLFIFSYRLLPENKIVFPRLPLMLFAALAGFDLVTLPMPLSVKLVVVTSLATIGVLASWLWLLSDHEKDALQMRLQRRQESA
ncbi:MAG TPA: flippase [Candidatus Angelobacter sp.]|nr:flippase [Candidatus Angelobacter sp.]